MTIEEAREICRVVAADFGLTLDVPVKESKTALKTWGMVKCERRKGKFVPTEIRFSTRLFEEEERFVLETIHHEMAHYLACKRTGDTHGHDCIFKSYALRLGCPLSATAGQVKNTDEEAKKYRYVLRCRDCGKIVSMKTRRCKMTMHPEYYRCGYCKGKLTVEQNW